MIRRGQTSKITALIAASTVLTGCASDHEAVGIRAIKDPASAIRQGNPELAQARAFLALGNVGLALEAYRKINRTSQSVDTYSGIAACYAAMGRLDLARTNYEAALAIEPYSPEILNALATILDRQGMAGEAVQARHDALAAQSSSLQPRLIPRPSRLSMTEMPGVVAQMPPETIQARQVAGASTGSIGGASVTVALPPASPSGQMVAQGPSITLALPPARPVARSVARSLARSGASAPRLLTNWGPRLERVTFGEVALVTTSTPLWATIQEPVHQWAASAERWTSLRYADSRPMIRILNAARSQGLAANAKATLHARGWRKIEIGDSLAIRRDSVVFYPLNRQILGRRLAAQFGIPARPGTDDILTVLLGQDSSRRPGAGQKG